MPKRPSHKIVATLKHEEASRKNTPTAELRSVMDRSAQSPVQVAYERRNRSYPTTGEVRSDGADCITVEGFRSIKCIERLPLTPIPVPKARRLLRSDPADRPACCALLR